MRADADACRWWHDAGDADEDADAGHLLFSAAQESKPLMTSCLATDVSDGYSRYYLVSPLSTIKSVLLLLAIHLSNFYSDADDISPVTTAAVDAEGKPLPQSTTR